MTDFWRCACGYVNVDSTRCAVCGASITTAVALAGNEEDLDDGWTDDAPAGWGDDPGDSDAVPIPANDWAAPGGWAPDLAGVARRSEAREPTSEDPLADLEESDDPDEWDPRIGALAGRDEYDVPELVEEEEEVELDEEIDLDEEPEEDEQLEEEIDLDEEPEEDEQLEEEIDLDEEPEEDEQLKEEEPFVDRLPPPPLTSPDAGAPAPPPPPAAWRDDEDAEAFEAPEPVASAPTPIVVSSTPETDGDWNRFAEPEDELAATPAAVWSMSGGAVDELADYTDDVEAAEHEADLAEAAEDSEAAHLDEVAGEEAEEYEDYEEVAEEGVARKPAEEEVEEVVWPGEEAEDADAVDPESGLEWVAALRGEAPVSFEDPAELEPEPEPEPEAEPEPEPEPEAEPEPEPSDDSDEAAETAEVPVAAGAVVAIPPPPPGAPAGTIVARPARRRSRAIVPLAIANTILVLAAAIALIVRSNDDDKTTVRGEAASATSTTLAPDAPPPVEIERLIAIVEQKAGQAFPRPPKVLRLATTEFNAHRAAARKGDLEMAGRVITLLTAFGAIADPVDPAAALDAINGYDAGGFYDGGSNELVVPAGVLSPFGQVSLAREIIVALDSQLYATGAVRSSVDAGLAFWIVRDGAAIRLLTEVKKTLPPATVVDADRVSRGRVASIPAPVATALGSGALVGPTFLKALLEKDPAYLKGVFERPPLATRDVLLPDAWINQAVPVVVPPPKADRTATDQGTFGELMLFTILQTAVPRTDAQRATGQWRGDSYVLWKSGDRSCVRMTIAVEGPGKRLTEALRVWAALNPNRSSSLPSPIVVNSCG